MTRDEHIKKIKKEGFVLNEYGSSNPLEFRKQDPQGLITWQVWTTSALKTIATESVEFTNNKDKVKK